MLQEFFFVSGAPRSGTTFVSDWLTQLPDTYCVHEVLADLKGRPAEEVLPALLRYAATGADRLDKCLQREFLSWPETGLEKDTPHLLGWKEPVTWGRDGIDAVPQPLRAALHKWCSKAVIIIRHPSDVVASGRRREATTNNWRSLSVEEHCTYWLSALDLIRDLESLGVEVLVLRWEDIIADPENSGLRLGDLIGRKLPLFTGYERDANELRILRSCVNATRGLLGHPSRGYLTADDEWEIRQMLGVRISEFGYEF